MGTLVGASEEAPHSKVWAYTVNAVWVRLRLCFRARRIRSGYHVAGLIMVSDHATGASNAAGPSLLQLCSQVDAACCSRTRQACLLKSR